MATKNTTPYAGRMSAEMVSQMVAHAQSNAAGVHQDQRDAKRNGTGRTNRMGSRSAILREAIRQNL